MAVSEPESPFSAPPEPGSRNWKPIIAGIVVVLLIVVAVTLIGRVTRSYSDASGDPYLSKLELSNLHMATAENFAGGSVTYIEGTLTNNADRKITGASAQVIFRNTLAEITQRETLPL